MKKKKGFDFKYIKVLVSRGKDDTDIKEVFLERAWVTKNNNIPHFASVIKNVDPNEGVEITISCNKFAFDWIVEFVRFKSDYDDEIN